MNVVMSTSHWQGASHYAVAIAPDRATAEHIADLLSTCSFCSPGRTGSYRVGACYRAATMRVAPNAPTLPDDAIEWSRADARAFIDQEDQI